VRSTGVANAVHELPHPIRVNPEEERLLAIDHAIERAQGDPRFRRDLVHAGAVPLVCKDPLGGLVDGLPVDGLTLLPHTSLKGRLLVPALALPAVSGRGRHRD